MIRSIHEFTRITIVEVVLVIALNSPIQLYNAMLSSLLHSHRLEESVYVCKYTDNY